MRSLNLKLNNSKFMMTHLEPHSSDPVEHEHGEDYQITIPLSGTPRLVLDNKSNLLNKNTRILTAPGEKHIHYTEDTESRILLINIKKSFVDKVLLSRLRKETEELHFLNYAEGSSEKLVKIADEAIRHKLFHEEDSVRLEEQNGN